MTKRIDEKRRRVKEKWGINYQIGRGRVVKVRESTGNGGNSGKGKVEIGTGGFGLGSECDRSGSCNSP